MSTTNPRIQEIHKCQAGMEGMPEGLSLPGLSSSSRLALAYTIGRRHSKRRKFTCTTTFQDSAYVPFSNVSLAWQTTRPRPNSKAEKVYSIFQWKKQWSPVAKRQTWDRKNVWPFAIHSVTPTEKLCWPSYLNKFPSTSHHALYCFSPSHLEGIKI